MMMKREMLLACVLAFVGTSELWAQRVDVSNNELFVSNQKLKWNETEHNFGEIKKGVSVSTVFEFTNTGNTEVLITEVRPGCGCTATDYTKEPIKPGGKGKITTTYGAPHSGGFTKTVTVTTQDTANPIVLTLVGTVKE